ncbi:yippee-domain-containing protein [Periconia macrospinosa]|uniref:Yippee-domain-containing protein n=1 Tax=Periconia macrospinosa TaxID=97972 RepID=A0A2V1DUZ0_9PLEO|nr:yippee-domain-containing protein [Periconia macrospinosa]
MSTTPFPLYLLPSIPFRRRRTSSTTTTSSVQTSSSSPSSSPPTYLTPPSTSYLRCSKCRTDLLPSTSIISKGFTGRHGRAYLVSPPTASTLYRPSPSTFLPPSQVAGLPNTKIHKPQPRQLVTGAHTVSDISCTGCGQVLGWKYVDAAEESQKYKVGKFILETKRVVRCVAWDEQPDEDECEDLFAGVWSRKVAIRRRRERGAWA